MIQLSKSRISEGTESERERERERESTMANTLVGPLVEESQGGRTGGEEASSSSPSSPSTVLDLLETLLAVQQRRAEAYVHFDSAFRAFVKGEEEGERETSYSRARAYEQACRSATTEFSECSSLAKGLESKLRGENESDLAQVVRDIQENEREKLQLHVQLQTLRKDKHVYKNVCSHEGCDCVEADFDLSVSADALYHGAIQRVYRNLQKVVTAINENIELIQDEVEDRRPTRD